MRKSTFVAFIIYFTLLMTLASCNESGEQVTEKNQGTVDVQETHIQPLSLEDNALQTRYGKLEITRSATDMPPDSLMLDGREVFRDEGFFTSLHTYIQQNERDLILFGSNCGGSGCPESHFQFLILHQETDPYLVSDDDFYALPDDISIKVDGSHIQLDLGFESGQHKSAVLDGDHLAIALKTVPKTYLGDEKCQWLHTDALNACVEHREIDPQCTEPQSGFAGYLMRGVAGMSDFPGFDEEAFNRHCTTSCVSGRPATFERFAREVCSRP